MERKALTVRIARWSATHPWRAMGLWIVFVIASIAVGSLVSTKQDENGGRVNETARAQQMIDSGHFPDDPSVERVLISSRSGPLDLTAARGAAEDAAARMRALHGVVGVDDPVVAPDGSMIMVPVRMGGDPKTADGRVQPLLDTTAAVAKDHPALRVEEVGDASVDKGLNDTVGKDFQRAEIFSLPVTLVILLVAFGALIAAGVPVLLAISAVGSAIGLYGLVSQLFPAQDSVNSVILLIGMAVGVDYSLFYLRREREERERGAGALPAVEIAAATSGRAVVVSGVAVIISMSGMFLANDAIFSSFAAGSILVVAVSVLGSLTVLPALLAKLGRWVDRPRVPLVWRLSAARRSSAGAAGAAGGSGAAGAAGAAGVAGAGGRHAAPGGFWSVLLRPSLRHPVITLVVSVGALAALAVPAAGMTLKLSNIKDVPRIPVVQAYDRMTAAFPSTGTEHVVVVRAPAARLAEVKAALDDLAARTAADPLFAHDQRPEVRTSPSGTVTMLTVATPYFSGTPEASRSLERLRGELVPQTAGRVPGAEYAVTGEIAGTSDYSQHIRQKLPIVVGFVLLLTFLVMAWTFRSLVIALTAIGLNMLSVGAAYGLLVAVFQHSWAEGLLGFHSSHAVISWLPLFLFVVLFGLSMDYHVFVVSRIREAVARGVPNREAVAQGLIRSAPVVTSAAVVMVGVFSIFGTLSFIEMKQLGVGLASAILIDATIIRTVVLPSLMILLGNANWWAPRFLRTRRSPMDLPGDDTVRVEPPERVPVG